MNPQPTVAEGEEEGEDRQSQEPSHEPSSGVIQEPAPPPFPHPAPGTGRLPPSYSTVVPPGTEQGRRSPPPDFEVALKALPNRPATPPDDNAEDSFVSAEEGLEQDDDEEIPPSPSTTSTVRRERIKRETPKQRRLRVAREKWQRQRDDGIDLNEMVQRERERIERMEHWGKSELISRTATPIVEATEEPVAPEAQEIGQDTSLDVDAEATPMQPQLNLEEPVADSPQPATEEKAVTIEEPEVTQDVPPTTITTAEQDEPAEVLEDHEPEHSHRFSRAEKGKGRAIMEEYAPSTYGDDWGSEGPSKIYREGSANIYSPREEIAEQQSTRKPPSPLLLEQHGEGSKISGFVVKELARAGFDVSDLIAEEQETESPSSPVYIQADTPKPLPAIKSVEPTPVVAEEPTTSAQAALTSTLNKNAETAHLLGSRFVEAISENPVEDPLNHGSRFVEGIREDKDGIPEVVPGVIDHPIVVTEEPEVEEKLLPPVPEQEVDVAEGQPRPSALGALRPLFSKKPGTSTRNISNPWALLRKTSAQREAKEEKEEDKTAEPIVSPSQEVEEEAMSPKDKAVSKSPFFRAAGALLKPNLGYEAKPSAKDAGPAIRRASHTSEEVIEKDKGESEVVKVNEVEAPKPPARRSSIKAEVFTTKDRAGTSRRPSTKVAPPVALVEKPQPTDASKPAQPFVYKHPFNRATRPAWMQQAAPIWKDPRAYVLDKESSAEQPVVQDNKGEEAVASPIANDDKVGSQVADLDKPGSQDKAHHELELQERLRHDIERQSKERAAAHREATKATKVRPPVPPRDRRERDTKPEPVTVNAFPPRDYPPPLLASQFAQPKHDEPESASSDGQWEGSDSEDDESSSDTWSVSDVVPRPPAAYRLLPPKGIPANVLRASNEPPPVPRRNRESRPKPLGPRARGAPPPLPPRETKPVPPAQVAAAATAANVVPISTTLEQPLPIIEQPVVQPVETAAVPPKTVEAPAPVERKVSAKADKVPTPPSPTSKPISKRSNTPSLSRPTTANHSWSNVPNAPTAGERTSATGVANVKNGKHASEMKPLRPSKPVESATVKQPTYPKAAPVTFTQPKPVLSQALPIRPRPQHHKTAPHPNGDRMRSRSGGAPSKLAIKPRFDDKPEMELKSQLSSRVNKWRMAAIRPDPPELYEPEESDEDIPVGSEPGVMSRSKSMPNFHRKSSQETLPSRDPSSPVQTPVSPKAARKSPRVEPLANLHPLEDQQSMSKEQTSRRYSQPKRTESGPSVHAAPAVEAAAEPRAAASPEFEYTDLDVVAARLQGTADEYEVSLECVKAWNAQVASADPAFGPLVEQGMNAITDFVGDEIPRGASPDRLGNLLLGAVEVESRRTTKDGKVKLKLTSLGIRVLKCSVCLSQFKAGDVMAMMPKCGHMGHQRCVVNWLTNDARCMVCREPL